MSEPVPGPAAPAEGCTGKGCAILLALVSLLGLALLAGTLWGVRYMSRYAADAPRPLTTPHASPSVPPARAPFSAPTTAEVPVEKWERFLSAVEKGDTARVTLSEAEINALLENAPETRGRVRVSTEGDVGRVQISLPLEGVFMMEGRFLNGELRVASAPNGDPAKARLFDLTLNGQPVSNDFLNRSLFGFPSLRGFIEGWIKEIRLTSFRIENGTVIAETGPPQPADASR